MVEHKPKFIKCLNIIFDIARSNSLPSIVIQAGQLYKLVEDQLDTNHPVMPSCCNAMRAAMSGPDKEIPNELVKDSSTFAVRYYLNP